MPVKGVDVSEHNRSGLAATGIDQIKQQLAKGGDT